MVAQDYPSIQMNAEQRVLDNRPKQEDNMPPLSLLYEGFGSFEDVYDESGPVPGEDDILEVQMWYAVKAFAEKMSEFLRMKPTGGSPCTNTYTRSLLPERIRRLWGTNYRLVALVPV